MGFTGFLVDIAKAVGALGVVLFTGVNGIDGVIMGNIEFTDYILLAVMVISMLYLFYTLTQLRTTSY